VCVCVNSTHVDTNAAPALIYFWPLVKLESLLNDDAIKKRPTEVILLALLSIFAITPPPHDAKTHINSC
jgi:hypothetical protein